MIDIWETAEKLNRFAQVLVSILQRNGIPDTSPQIFPVHQIIEGNAYMFMEHIYKT